MLEFWEVSSAATAETSSALRGSLPTQLRTIAGVDNSEAQDETIVAPTAGDVRRFACRL
jgi:hypothetical protein